MADLTVSAAVDTIMSAADYPAIRAALDLEAGTDFFATRTGVYRHLYIAAASFAPRTTNGAEAATEEYVTNDITLDQYLFDTTTEEGIQVAYMMPDEWDLGTIKYKIIWDPATGASAADTVSWGVRAGAISNDDPIDAALGTQIVVNDIVIAVGDVHVSPASAALTIAGTPALGDLCVFQVVRNVSGTDDMVEDAKFLGLAIQYKESTTEASIW